MKEKDYNDPFLRQFIQKLPMESPSEEFVNKVMNKCSMVEIKEPFNIFVWIREKQSNMVISITTKIVNILKNWVDIYYERVEMGVIPIYHN